MHGDATPHQRVLLVEDDPPTRMLLCDVLTSEGYEVVQAEDGEEGLRLARECEPDVVLLDLMLPRKSGWSVLEELRRSQPTRTVPIVIVSAFAQMFPTIELAEVDRLVPKPFELDDLLDEIRAALRRPAQA